LLVADDLAAFSMEAIGNLTLGCLRNSELVGNAGLTWNPSKGAIEAYSDRQAAINQPNFSWQAIIQGIHDGYITQFAQELRLSLSLYPAHSS